MIKKHISLLICIGLIINMCSCSLEKSKRNQNTVLSILVFDGENHLNPAGALEKYERWETEFNNMFNENINLEAKLIKPWGFGEIGDHKFETEVQDFTSGGIILMPIATYDSLFHERENYFEPLDRYIDYSDLRSEWPESLIEFGLFPGDEKIWCLPTQYSASMILRAYNKKALTDMGLSAPTTIDEFTVALGQYYMDYNKSPILINLEESNPMLQSNLFAQFSDIFALGGIKNIETIVYDYTVNQYRNIIDLNNTEVVLNLLKDLYDGGIIGLDSTFSANSYNSLLSDGDVFSALVRGPSIMRFDKIEFSNINYENNSLVHVNQEQVSYVAVLLKGTKNAEEVLNKFIDFFLINGEKYIAASRGFEGIHYEFKDGFIIPKKGPQYPLGVLSRFSDYDLEYYIKDKDRNVYKEYKEAFMANQHIVDPYYLLYFLKYNVFDGREKENEIQSIFSAVFSKLFTEDSSVQELIDEYKGLCYEKGVENYIDDANYKLKVMLEGLSDE